MIRIEIPGEPVSQGRPRATAALGHVKLYDPPKSRAYKQTVSIYARQAMGQRLPGGLSIGSLPSKSSHATEKRCGSMSTSLSRNRWWWSTVTCLSKHRCRI
ncbi:RusA family crossover junction endodeoxyribonuclease [Schleiferilactobacillus perolens]